jgi:hypothetical protein
LQEAIDAAQCGDTLELQVGATFTGKFVFPAKNCDDSHWVIIRTSTPDSRLPPEGTRLTPCYAGIASLPGRPAFRCPSPENVLAKLVFDNKGGNGPVVFAAGAGHYRFLGLEITRGIPGVVVRSLMSLEKDATADHLIFDRIWVHGTAQDETTRGLQFGSSRYVAVVDSYFSDFHCIARSGSCTDSQAIGGGNGEHPMGPYKIVNNFLEAAGENVIFGGGHSTMTPADIEIRRNHMFKPLTWKKGSPGFVGGRDGDPFIVKNLFELKNAQRVLLEGNILENTWGGFTQKGFGILLTPKNQAGREGSLCPLCRVTDVTIRNNWIAHMASGFQIANGLSATGGVSTDGGRYSIHDVILEDIDGETYGGFGNLALIGSKAPPLHDVAINHITAFPQKALFNLSGEAGSAKIVNFTFTNNLVGAGKLEITSSGGGRTNCAFGARRLSAADTLNNCFSNPTFTHNLIVGGGKDWPKDNIVLKSFSAAGLARAGGHQPDDYRLQPSSPARGTATDGKDIGADVEAIISATAGVL